DGVDDVVAAAPRGADLGRVVLGRLVGAGALDELEVVPVEGVVLGVVALLGDVDLQVVGAVLGLVVQVHGEGAADLGGLPRAGVVQGVVPAVLGLAGAAQLVVGDVALEVTAGALAVQAVPVPHRVGVVLPCLPAHGVFLLHGRVLEV